MNTTALLLETTLFAARQHRYQRRKDHGDVPYVNHVIEVAELISGVGGIDDVAVLQAALLHDTVEDTETTFAEIEERYGQDVRDLVEEMTDDKTLEKQERKRRQIISAPNTSSRGKLVKLADKISNVRDIAHRPPPDWTLERRRTYIRWATDVVSGCRGTNRPLEALFDEVIEDAWKVLGSG